MSDLLYILKITSGPKKNSVFEIKHKKILIGRSSHADIVLNTDPTCSRSHATIKLHNGELFLENKSDQGKTLLNNRTIKTSTLLNPGDQITIGKTTLDILFNKSRAHIPSTQNIKKIKLNFKKLVIFGAVLLAVVFLLSRKSEKKLEKNTLKNDIELIEDQTKKLIKEHEEIGLKTESYKKAQKFYVQGFRDFKKGQFKRATHLFQSCLALEPTHILCGRYVVLSQRKFSEIIQYHVVLGRKYLKQHQNQSCVTTFKNVMIMIEDTNNPLYKEAKTNRELCKTRLQGKY